MRWRLIFSFLAVVLVAIFSVILIVRLDNENQVQNYLFRGGMSGADGLVTSLEAYYNQNQGWSGIESQFSMMHTGGGMGGGRRSGSGGMMSSARIRLADAKGRILVDTTGTSVGGNLNTNEVKSGIQLKDLSGQFIGSLVIEGSSTAQRGDELPLISKLNDAAWRAGLISLAVALILALLLATGVIRPVRHLITAARQLAAGDLTHRVDVKGMDELAELGRTFNDMADSLHQSEQRRREMTADIAHELRSPLAVQRAHLEALQDGIYPLTIENLQPVLDQSALLERLVEDLRTLALADAGELKLVKIEVNLKELLEGILEQFKATAENRSVTLSLSVDQNACLIVHADPDRLAQVMNNLLTNAIRHSPNEGNVQLRLTCEPGFAVISVQDSGSGIPNEALPLIFDRFYRADQARSRDKGGFGLGLAIARQLVLAHGGFIEAANSSQGGAVLTLKLPA